MYCDGLAIAVHVLTPSAGLPDYCASGGDVEKWSTTEEHIFNRADSNRLKKKKNQTNNLSEHTEEVFTP